MKTADQLAWKSFRIATICACHREVIFVGGDDVPDALVSRSLAHRKPFFFPSHLRAFRRQQHLTPAFPTPNLSNSSPSSMPPLLFDN